MLFLIRAAALLEGLSLTLIQGFLPLYVRKTLGESHFLIVGAVVGFIVISMMLPIFQIDLLAR